MKRRRRAFVHHAPAEAVASRPIGGAHPPSYGFSTTRGLDVRETMTNRYLSTDLDLRAGQSMLDRPVPAGEPISKAVHVKRMGKRRREVSARLAQRAGRRPARRRFADPEQGLPAPLSPRLERCHPWTSGAPLSLPSKDGCPGLNPTGRRRRLSGIEPSTAAEPTSPSGGVVLGRRNASPGSAPWVFRSPVLKARRPASPVRGDGERR